MAVSRWFGLPSDIPTSADVMNGTVITNSMKLPHPLLRTHQKCHDSLGDTDADPRINAEIDVCQRQTPSWNKKRKRCSLRSTPSGGARK